jgi:hypothetical protein
LYDSVFSSYLGCGWQSRRHVDSNGLIAKDVVVIIILRCVKRARHHGAYVAPFYDTEEFGSCFYSIHVPKSVSQPIEQLNYAHIIVEKG